MTTDQWFNNPVNHTDYLLNEITNGLYDPLFAGKENLVFLDIGANIGLVSLEATKHCKMIVAVEPAPETFDMLCKMTHKHPEIATFNAALAPENGWVTFYVNDINSTASSTVNTHGTKISVPGFTLNEILKSNFLDHVDICKIDAEGAEGESLTLEQLKLASGIIDSYFIEMHNCPDTTWEHKLATIAGRLSECGYNNMQLTGTSIWAKK